MTRTRAGAAASAVFCVLALGSCAHALKEPPPVAVMAGGGAQAPASEVPALLERAGARLRARTAPAAREAANLYLQAAQADESSFEGFVGAARALVWLTLHEQTPEARQQAATEAVQAAQWCERRAPESASCAYWMGASLGVQAKERPSTGLSALPKIEEAFQRAAKLDPALEDGGPDRSLALLYLRAPAWPAGPGDPDKGLQEARKAVAIAAEYPPNLLVLGEALAATGDQAAAAEAFRKARAVAMERATQGDREATGWVHDADQRLSGQSAR